MSVMQALAAQQKQQLIQISQRKQSVDKSKSDNTISQQDNYSESDHSSNKNGKGKGILDALMKLVQRNSSVERSKNKQNNLSKRSSSKDVHHKEARKNNPSLEPSKLEHKKQEG